MQLIKNSGKPFPTSSQKLTAWYWGLVRTVRQISLSLWLWELSSLLLSISCIVATMAIIARYDNKPVPEWKYGLTINGVLSLLSGVAKASMILPVAEGISQLKWHWFWNHRRAIMDFQRFDGASRGPWGCLMMLCNPKGLNLALVGALVTVAALLLEPFIQLIPSYPSLMAPYGTSSLPRSFYYRDVEMIFNPVDDNSSA